MSTQRLLRELQAEFPDAQLAFTGGGHIRLRFPCGATVFVSASPSKTYFMNYVRRDVQRAKRLTAERRAG